MKTEGGIEKTERETEAQARRGKTEGRIRAHKKIVRVSSLIEHTEIERTRARIRKPQMKEKIGGMPAMGIENAAQRPLVMGGL